MEIDVIALDKARRRIREAPEDEAARVFLALLQALESGTPFQLDQIYQLAYPDFEIALEVIENWRLHRYGRALRRAPRADVGSGQVAAS